MTPHVTLIAAVAANRAIGYQNRLLFHLPADLRRFKALTTGHTIIMGRRTFLSLPKGALPQRRNVVLSRQPGLTFPETEVYGSLPEALASCRADEQVFVIGGESVYAEALPLAARLCLTHIEAVPEAADAFFPEFDPSAWRQVAAERHEPDEKNAWPYTFADYERI